MSTWEDRRAMFQRGKEVHEPSQPLQPRRTSTSSIGSSQLAKTLSNASNASSSAGTKAGTSPVSAAAGSGLPSPGAERRRSSGAGMFANLHTQKRGSESYGDRRSSIEEMEAGKGSAFSGWYNSTFRGMQKVKEEAALGTSMPGSKSVERRGVME